MRNKKSILLGAVLAATPAVSHGATITYQYYNVAYSTTLTGTYTTATVSNVLSGVVGSAEIVTVPQGDYVKIGLEAQVTNNGGAGLYAFNVGFNNSNPASSFVFSNGSGGYTSGTALPSVGVSGTFSLQTYNGQYDGKGGVLGTPAGGIYGAFSSTSANGKQAATGVGAYTPLLKTMIISAATGGTSSFTPIQVNGGTGFLNTAPQETAAATTGQAYTARTFTAGTDTVGTLPTLTIVTTGGVTTTTTTTSTSLHAIVSLAPGGTATYGPQLGSITLTGKGSGSYTPGTTAFAAATTGYVVTSAFSPITDTEVYALKLEYNSGSGEVVIPTNSALNTTIANDLKGTGVSNVSAGTVSGSPYASLFPGYDIILTSTAAFTASANGTADLDVDFSQDTDTATPGLVVIGAAAVPEPATAAGVVIGAAGLLLGRRKSRTLA